MGSETSEPTVVEEEVVTEKGTPEPSEPVYNSRGELVEYAIQSDAFFWLTSDWVTALWIVESIFSGIVAGGLYYCSYLIVKEVLMWWPVNIIEASFDGVAWEDLDWPTRVW